MEFARDWALQETPLQEHKKAPFRQAPKQLQMQQHLHYKLCGARITLKFAKSSKTASLPMTKTHNAYKITKSLGEPV